jgi:4-hydroxy-tetrahydrodipicolinate reductase
MTSIAVNGASGRMGRALCALSSSTPGTTLAAAFIRPNSTLVGRAVSEVVADANTMVKFASSAELSGNYDVMIEFTTPELTLCSLELCLKHTIPMVIGTTGFNPSQLERIEQASKTIPIVFAANMSVGVTVALSLVELAAKALGGDYDTEIIEAHHRYKKDSPSGTALAFGEVIAKAQGKSLQDHAVYGREGMIGERPQNEIGFSTVRGGDVIGDHTVMFLGDGDRLEITHKASNRDTFARGAVRAAQWVVEQPAGLYSMKDVLGLTS